MTNTTNAYELGMYEKAVPPSLTWLEKLQAAKTQAMILWK